MMDYDEYLDSLDNFDHIEWELAQDEYNREMWQREELAAREALTDAEHLEFARCEAEEVTQSTIQ